MSIACAASRTANSIYTSVPAGSHHWLFKQNSSRTSENRSSTSHLWSLASIKARSGALQYGGMRWPEYISESGSQDQPKQQAWSLSILLQNLWASPEMFLLNTLATAQRTKIVALYLRCQNISAPRACMPGVPKYEDAQVQPLVETLYNEFSLEYWTLTSH